jgi:hypothetical protein
MATKKATTTKKKKPVSAKKPIAKKNVLISAKEALNITNEYKKDKSKKLFINIQKLVDSSLDVISKEIIHAANMGLDFVVLDGNHGVLFFKDKDSFSWEEEKSLAFDKVVSILEDNDYDVNWDKDVSGPFRGPLGFTIRWE